jgi:pimeloyl-ACP methyl ester carboxylesterase
VQTTRSADGTPIALRRSGEGPALVLVTGAFCDASSPAPLQALLAPRFSVLAYDRRGRGSSGDCPPYAVQREVEDLAAVIDAAGGTASIYGHSSGARLALDAAAAGVPMSRLAVYEPPFNPGNPDPDVASWRARVEALLAAGDRRGAATEHLLGSGTPEHVVEHMRSAPWWPAMEALAHTLPYDEALCGDLTIPVGRLAGVAVPTLVLAGGNSDPDWRAALRTVAGTLRDGRYAELDGQHHVPADDVLAPVLADFFAGAGG